MTCERLAQLEEASSIPTVLGPRDSCGCHHMLPIQALAQQMAKQPSCTSPWSPFAAPSQILLALHGKVCGCPCLTLPRSNQLLKGEEGLFGYLCGRLLIFMGSMVW